MTAYLLRTAGLLLILQLCLLLPETNASYNSYSSYYATSVFYACSVSCIAGAVFGALVFIGGLIGLIVFLCCLYKATKVRRVQPTVAVVGTTALMTTGASYPRQQHHLQQPEPQPPAYDQNIMYPPYPPPGEQQADHPHVAMPSTAYPPPPPYQTTWNAQNKF